MTDNAPMPVIPGGPAIDDTQLGGFFQGVDKFDAALPEQARQNLAPVLAHSMDRDGQRTRIANQLFLAKRYNRPVSDIVDSYEAYRGDYARKAFGADEIDDKGFYAQAGTALKRQATQTQMLGDMNKALYQHVVDGGSVTGFAANYLPTLKANPSFDRNHLDLFYQNLHDQAEVYQKFGTDHHDAIAAVSDYAKLAAVGSGDPTEINAKRDAALHALNGLPGDQQGLVLALAHQGIKAPDAGFAEKVAGRLERGVTDTATAAVGFLQEFSPTPGAGAQFQSDAPLRKTERRLDQMIKGQVDPMSSNSVWGRAALSTAESLPRVIASFTPEGLAINFAAAQSEMQGAFEDKGIPGPKAAAMAVTGGAAQTALQFVSAHMIAGKVPGLEGWIAGLSSKVAKLAAVGGVESTVLGASSIAQGQTPNAVQFIASTMDDTMPKVSKDEFFQSLKEEVSPSALLQLLPMVMVGTGFGSFKSKVFAKEYLTPERLKAAGYQEPMIEKVAQAETLPQIESALQQGHKDRVIGSPEQRSALADVETLGTKPSQLPEGHIPVEVKREDGTTYQAAMNGYYDLSSLGKGQVPSIGRQTEAGWSHGMLQEGETINHAIPNADEWASGIRDVSRNDSVSTGTGVETPHELKMLEEWKAAIAQEKEAEPTISKNTDGTYEVKSAEGQTIAETNTAEMAAKVAADHTKGLISGSGAESWADRVIKDSVGRVNAGVDPLLFAAYTVKGAALIERGVNTFADWSARMLKEHGQGIQQDLQELWDSANARIKAFKAQPPERGAWDDVKRVLAADTRGPTAALAAGVVREMGAERAMQADRAKAALKEVSDRLMKMSPADRWDWVDRIETGRPQATPELQAGADTFRQISDAKLAKIQGLGIGALDHFIQDYFPHIWKDPEKAKNAFASAMSKRPMEGSKKFLKERVIPTIKEGMALGLEPETDNPVDLALLKFNEQEKFYTAQKSLLELRKNGLLQFVGATDKPPTNYEKIDDRIATVYGNPSHPGAQQIEGHYYAPQEVAQVVNNYLSPGLRASALYRNYASLANGLNQFQLGLSFFHLGFVSYDSATSQVAAAIEHASIGNLGSAVKALAKTPIAPLTTVLEGNKVLKEWLKPGGQGAEIAAIVESLRKAGGRAKQDSLYQTTTTENMVKAFKEGNVVGGVWRAPFAVLEQVAKPLMEHFVPRMKLGVFAEMARVEMSKLPPGASDVQVREAMGKAWDSVDNRMGQMVYDNVFWNKMIKDMAMISVRSVGWNLGTLRELGGAAVDTVKAGKAIAGGERPEVTHKMAYAIALPAMSATLGAMTGYLLTGKGPDELRDYFFPKTGQKDPQGRDIRLSLPSYMKDIYHYGHDPIATVVGKIHPALSLSYQMLNNKDFFDREIRHPDDPLVKQMLDTVKFFGNSIAPIGVKQAQQSALAQTSKAEVAANLVGITRAPAWVGETEAEQLAGKLAGDKFKSSTAPDAKIVADRGRIQMKLRNGTPEEKTDAKQELKGMVQSGELTDRQAKNLLKGVDHTYLENALSHLDAKEAMRVFAAASTEEREAIKEEVQRKIAHAHLRAEDKTIMLTQLNKLSPATGLAKK